MHCSKQYCYIDRSPAYQKAKNLLESVKNSKVYYSSLEKKRKNMSTFSLFSDIDKGTNYTLQLITIRNIEIPKKYLDNN